MKEKGRGQQTGNQTDEKIQARLDRRRETTAKGMVKMDEEELGIYRTKDSVSRSKTRKHKWLCNSGALAYDDGARVSMLDLSSLGAALG